MSDKPNTHVVSVVAQALLMDQKKPCLYNINMDLLTFLKGQYPELWTSHINAENVKGWNTFEKYKNILNGILLKKVPGLIINDEVNAFSAIENVNKDLGIPAGTIEEINNIRIKLEEIVNRHCGTLKEIEMGLIR